MLLTRAPLYRGRSPFSCDLHVLGAPLTFVLSQDQTLQLESVEFAGLSSAYLSRTPTALALLDWSSPAAFAASSRGRVPRAAPGTHSSDASMRRRSLNERTIQFSRTEGDRALFGDTGAPNLGKRKVVASAYPVNIFLVRRSLFSAAPSSFRRSAADRASPDTEGVVTLSRDPEVVKEKGAKSRPSRGLPRAGQILHRVIHRHRPRRSGLPSAQDSASQSGAQGTRRTRSPQVAPRREPSPAARRRDLRGPGGGTYSWRNASQRTKRRLGTFSFSQPISRGNRASRRPGQDFGGRFVRRSIASSAYHAPPGSRMTVVSRPVVTPDAKSTLSALEAHHRPEHLEALQARCADLREGARARARVALDDDGPPERPVVTACRSRPRR